MAPEPRPPSISDDPDHERRWQRWGIILAIIAALIGGGVTIGLFNTDDRSVTGDCNGQNNDCSEADGPTMTVDRAAFKNGYVLRTSNWQPHSELTVEVTFPTGEPADIGDETKTTDAGGAYSTSSGHYLWLLEPGEPEGTYKVTVSGIGAEGDQVTLRGQFIAPWPN